MADYTPPDIYEPHLAQLRTPELRAAAEQRAARFAAIDAEADEVSTENTARLRAMAAEASDLDAYAPPDIYAAGIKALQEKK